MSAESEREPGPPSAVGGEIHIVAGGQTYVLSRERAKAYAGFLLRAVEEAASNVAEELEIEAATKAIREKYAAKKFEARRNR